MKRNVWKSVLVVNVLLAMPAAVWAGQVPGAASDADIAITHRDRVYTAEQFSNTISVTDPVDRSLRSDMERRGSGTIRILSKAIAM